jgi:hypothetical protein
VLELFGQSRRATGEAWTLAPDTAFTYPRDVQGTLPLVLLVAALVVAVVQSWRLGRERALGQADRAAASREEEREVAAHARALRAVDGEERAAALLERAGFAVLERQVPGSWTLRADGEPVTFGLRADYLVMREGRRYIAEVKTGRLAPRLSHGPTRRQLLEYRAAFDVHGVILVDADVETITHVELDVFADRASRRTGWAEAAPWALAVALLVIGLFVGSATRIGTDLGAAIESLAGGEGR